MPDQGSEPARSARSLAPSSPATDGEGAVARVYSFLAAALAGDQRPDPDALAAEIARVFDVQSLAVFCDDGDELRPVLSFGFSGDPVEALGHDLLDQAFGDGMAVLVDAEEPLRTRFACPAQFAGQPWGVVAVGSPLQDAISAEKAGRLEDLAQGIAVVLNPLSPYEAGTGPAKGRRLRVGLESVMQLAAGIPLDASFRVAAKALADAMAREFGWQRVLVACERPDLGVLPTAVAGEVHASGVQAPERLVTNPKPGRAAVPPAPFFEGSRSQLLIGLDPPAGSVASVLVVEDVRVDAFDDLDEHVARTVAAIAGPLLQRLAAREVGEQEQRQTVASDERQRRRFTSLAHELRTPVTVMLGYADLLATPGRDSDQRQAYASTLARHARSLGRMVDNALVAWQLDDGTLELSQGAVDLHACCDDVVQQLGAEVDLSEVGKILASGDSFWLPKVVQALLENARRYVPDAEVRLSTDVRGPTVRLAVHDNGPGIEAAELVHIFDAFHRGEDGGTGPHRGVGLGLTVARALVREMGGDLEVASAQGYGTTFTVTLPQA